MDPDLLEQRRIWLIRIREFLPVVEERVSSLLVATVSAGSPGADGPTSPTPGGFDGDISVILPFLVSAFITTTAVPSTSLAIAASDRTRMRRSYARCSRKIILGKNLVPPFSWASRSIVVLFLLSSVVLIK